MTSSHDIPGAIPAIVASPRSQNKPRLIASVPQSYKRVWQKSQDNQNACPAIRTLRSTHIWSSRKGELAYQFSPEAGRAVFYPRVLCPFTGSAKLEWRVSKGLGTVYSTTVVHPAEGSRSTSP